MGGDLGARAKNTAVNLCAFTDATSVHQHRPRHGSTHPYPAIIAYYRIRAHYRASAEHNALADHDRGTNRVAIARRWAPEIAPRILRPRNPQHTPNRQHIEFVVTREITNIKTEAFTDIHPEHSNPLLDRWLEHMIGEVPCVTIQRVVHEPLLHNEYRSIGQLEARPNRIDRRFLNKLSNMSLRIDRHNPMIGSPTSVRTSQIQRTMVENGRRPSYLCMTGVTLYQTTEIGRHQAVPIDDKDRSAVRSNNLSERPNRPAAGFLTNKRAQTKSWGRLLHNPIEEWTRTSRESNRCSIETLIAQLPKYPAQEGNVGNRTQDFWNIQRKRPQPSTFAR